MKYYALILSIMMIVACSNNDNNADAYGNFEANEIIISSESAGKIQSINFDEGSKVNAGDILAVIDTVQLSLKRGQLDASIDAVSSKTRDIQSQIDVLSEQKVNLEREYERFKRLVRDSAATRKQLDDIEGQIKVVDKNIVAMRRSLSDANRAVLSEIKPLEYQKKQLDDNLYKSYISSPIDAVVLKKYAEAGEVVGFGKPLMKLANLDNIILRVYVSGDMLAKVKIGNNVKVRIDNTEDSFLEYNGKVDWVSEQAEFTPKIVQTKKERVNLVYAVKVAVKNDGKIKIGMPGEVIFSEK